MRSFELPRVVGSGNVQSLICATIDLPSPAEEIKEIRKTVIIDNCRVVFDKVIIDGRLRKDIMFKAANAGFPQPGAVQGCGGVLTTIAGAIQDVDVDIAFTALVPVPGACPDDQCVVLEAFVEGEKEEPANILETGAFTNLINKSIVFICVKVIRDEITELRDDDDDHDDDDDDHDDHDDHDDDDRSDMGKHSHFKGKQKEKKKEKKHLQKKGCGVRGHDLCPKPRSTGFFPGGPIPAPKPGLTPGTWIGPTLVFPGVLNPGIPALSPLPNVILSPASTQVQVTRES